jgi:hypothetical protein
VAAAAVRQAPVALAPPRAEAGVKLLLHGEVAAPLRAEVGVRLPLHGEEEAADRPSWLAGA